MAPEAKKLRTAIRFTSPVFNSTEVKDSFINPCCFGEDVAKFVTEKWKGAGYEVGELCQEDWGWSAQLKYGEQWYYLNISLYSDTPGPPSKPPAFFLMFVEKNVGFWKSLFSKESKNVEPEFLLQLHAVLSGNSEIEDLSWCYEDENYEDPGSGSPTP